MRILKTGIMSHYSTDCKFYNPDNTETIILKSWKGEGGSRFPFLLHPSVNVLSDAENSSNKVCMS